MKAWCMFRAVVGAVMALTLAAPSMGNETGPGPDPESFRSELLSFAGDLEGLPRFKTGRVAGFAQIISALPPEQLTALAQRAPHRADWRALPQVLRNLDALRAEREARLRAKLAARSGPRDSAAELEEFRQDFLFFITGLQAMAPLATDTRLAVQLADLEAKVAGLPSEHLGQLRRTYYHNAPYWRYLLRGGKPASDPDLPPAKFDLLPTIPTFSCDIGCPCDFDCDMNCSWYEAWCWTAEGICYAAEEVCDVGCDAVEGICDGLTTAIEELNSVIDEINGFLDDVVSFFDDVVDEIEALPSTMGNFFTELGTDLIDLLEDLLDAALDVIPDSQELLELLGLDDIDSSFYTDLVDGLTLVEMPCPDIGTNISGYGEVGSPRAEYVCKRGADWLAEKLYDLVPDDVYDVPVKLLAAIPYYPIKYFCLCMEAQSSLSFAEAQEEHRELVAERLDAALSTRASEASVTALDTTVDTLDDDVADVRSDVAEVDAEVGVVASELTVLEAAVDDYSTAQDDQLDSLEAFRDLVLRIRIEENLLQGSPEDVVASFQSPEEFAGFLDLVREIVTETIQMNLDAGQSVYDAPGYLALADALLQEGAFEKAYGKYRLAYREAVKQ